MDWTETGVVAGGAAAVALVLWYFFGEREACGMSMMRGELVVRQGIGAGC